MTYAWRIRDEIWRGSDYKVWVIFMRLFFHSRLISYLPLFWNLETFASGFLKSEDSVNLIWMTDTLFKNTSMFDISSIDSN